MNCQNVIRLFVALGMVFIPTKGFSEDTNYGTFAVSKGDITISRIGGAQEKARIGSKVYPKESITAGKDSRAKVIFVDKNVMNISPDTKVTVQAYNADTAGGGARRQVEMKIDYGKVRNTVNQKYDGRQSSFTVKTPSAVAGVRGTDFMASFSDTTKATKIVTFAGAVDVGKTDSTGKLMGEMVRVVPGTFTVTTPEMAKPAPPSKVPTQELAKMNNETNADRAMTDRPAGAPGNDGGDSRGPASSNSGEGGGESSMINSNDLGPTAGGTTMPMNLGPAFGPPPGPALSGPPMGHDFLNDSALPGGRTNIQINIVY